MKKVITFALLIILCFGAINVNAVQMYALDGRNEWVPDYNIDAWRAVGWYTSDDIYTQIVQPSYNTCKSVNDYLGMMDLAQKYLPFVYGTSHEASLYAVRTEAMDLWRNILQKPIGIGRAVLTNGNHVKMSFANLSYKPIKYFEFKYKCYDQSGKEIESKYRGARYDQEITAPGQIRNLQGNIGASNVYIMGDVRVTKVIYTDGSIWEGE